MKLKKVKTSHTLVIGCAHLGMSVPVLEVLRNVQNHYKANVVHIGPLATRDEINVFNHRVRKCRVLSEEIKPSEEKALLDITNLQLQQAKRIELLNKYFPGIEYVSNEESMISFDNEYALILGNTELSQYLTKMQIRDYYDNYMSMTEEIGCSALMANGERISSAPITQRIEKALKRWGDAHILPHPIAMTKTLTKPKPGEVRCLWTTGSLAFPPKIHRVSETFALQFDPGALLVAHNADLGVSHVHRITLPGNYKSTKTHTVIDGLLFNGLNTPIEIHKRDRATYITDVHAPYQENDIVEIFAQINGKYDPDLIVDGGDVADFSSVSRHTKAIRGKREGLRLIEDLDSMAEVMSRYDRHCSPSQKVLIDSNHQDWLTQFIEENPELVGILDWQTIARTRLDGWTVLQGSSEIFTFGDLTIRHGHQDGALTKASLTFGKYICGHFHSHEQIGNAARIGCACHLSPSYLGGNQTAWLHQFVILGRYKNSTHLSIKTISTKGKTKYTWFNGSIWSYEK